MAAASIPTGRLERTRRLGDRVGDGALYGLTALAAAVGLAIVAAIVWRVADGAWPAIRAYHLGFLWHDEWNPVTSRFGARDFVVGTIVTSFGAILLSAPLSIAVALFLSELAPPAIRGPVGTLIELLAAVPSVVVGLWGIYVLAPFAAHHVAPLLGGGRTESTIFAAILVLAIMTIPITSSICRELFTGVPTELEEGSIALGATRWEMVRTVVIPSVRGGVVAAIILGLGRALGEAIAVTQVIGNFIPLKGLFDPGDTLASRLANQFAGAGTNIQAASLIYLGLILLVVTFVTNLAARRVVTRFTRE
ncbi:MAG TPA: phosphate ABC transporter permease subunit PstC [Gaiellaceae bacterium]|nr:phosphate ABC transporter permease subunit PstC [Gaiellaceae bacterium]